MKKRILKLFIVLMAFISFVHAVNAENEPGLDITKVYHGQTEYQIENGAYHIQGLTYEVDYSVTNVNSDYCLIFYTKTYMEGMIDILTGKVVCDYNTTGSISLDFMPTTYFGNDKNNEVSAMFIKKADLNTIVCDTQDDYCVNGYGSTIGFIPESEENILADTIYIFNETYDSLQQISFSNYKIYDSNNNEVEKTNNVYTLEVNKAYYIQANVSNYLNSANYSYYVIDDDNNEQFVVGDITYNNGVIKFPFTPEHLGDSGEFRLSVAISDANQLFEVYASEYFGYTLGAEKLNWVISGDVGSNLKEFFQSHNVNVSNVTEIIFNNKLKSGHTYTNSSAIDLSTSEDRSVVGQLINGKLYIEFSGILQLQENAYNLFAGFPNVTSISGFDSVDTSRVTSMLAMFYNNPSLTSLDLSHFNTSNVTDMASMFSGDTALVTLNVNNFDTSKVTSMYAMFKECTSLSEITLTSFNTSNVKTMASMFEDDDSLFELDLSSFNTSAIQEVSYMFYNMDRIKRIYVSPDFVTSNALGIGVKYFTGSVSLVGGNGTTYEEARQQNFIGYDVIDSVEAPGLFSYKFEYIADDYFVSAVDYIDIGTSTFDPSIYDATNGVNVVYENNKLNYIYNGLTLHQTDIVSYNSNKYDLNAANIDTGTNAFSLDNITVVNATKEYNNGVLTIKYGDTILKSYEVYSTPKFNLTSGNLYVDDPYRGFVLVTVGNYEGTYNSEIDSYGSSNNSVATVTLEDGSFKIRAVDSGTATITVTLKNGRSATYTATVYNTIVNSVTAPITEFTKDINDEPFNLNVVVDAGNDAPPVTYINDNTNVVEVSETGEVTIIGPGHANVYAYSRDKHAEISIDVLSHITALNISVPGSMERDYLPYDLKFGEKTIEVLITPENTTDAKTINLVSNNSSVVEVKSCNGVVCTVDVKKAGSATLTATSVNNKTATKEIIVPILISTSAQGGTITVENNAQLADVGSTVNFSIDTPNTYIFKSVDIYDENNNKVSTEVGLANNSFTAPDYNVTIKAEFEKKSYQIKYNEPNATFEVYTSSNIEDTQITEAKFGTRIFMSVQPKEGYVLKEVKILNDNGEDVSSEIDYIQNNSFTMPTCNVNIVPVLVAKELTAPVLTIEKGNNNSLIIKWNEQEFAQKYLIYRTTDTKKWGKVFATLYRTEDNQYIDNDLSYGVKYYYKVVAYNEETGRSDYSNVVSKKVVPNKVSNLEVTSRAATTIKIGWNKVSASGYEVFISTDNKKWTKEATITKNKTITYSDTGLKRATKYYYKVRAYKLVGTQKVYGSFSDVVNATTGPNAPVISSIKATGYNTIQLEIKKTKTASYYVVQRSTDNKKFTTLDSVSSLSYIDMVNTGTKYYYRVKACNSYKVCSKYSSVVSAKTKLATPKITYDNSIPKTVILTTNSIVGADGYIVQRSTKIDKDFTNIGKITDLSELTYSDVNLKTGKTYYYRVRAYINVEGKKVYSGYSKVIKVIVK